MISAQIKSVALWATAFACLPTLHASEEGKFKWDYRKKGMMIEGNPDAAIEEIKKVKEEDRKSIGVKLWKFDQEDLEKLSTISWIGSLELAGEKDEFQSLEPLANFDSITGLTLFKVTRKDRQPLDLTPLTKHKKLIKASFKGTAVKNTIALAGNENLKDVNLHMCKVDSIEFLSTCPNVERLDLFGKDHSFPDYKPLAALKNLKELTIRLNPQATDENLAPVAVVTTLEKVDMMDCIKLKSLDFLESSKGLRYLEAMHSKNLEDISALEGCVKLQKLNLTDTSVKDLSAISSMDLLSALTLTETPVADLSPLTKCKRLGILNVGETKVADLTLIPNCENITALNIEHTKVADLSPLADCKKLSGLRLSGCEAKDLSPLLKVENLSYLEVSPGFPEDQLDALRAAKPKLRIRVTK